MEKKLRERVVITGLGVIAPNGIGKERFWQANINGKSGISLIESFDTSQLETRIGGIVKDFEPLQYIERSLLEKLDRFAQFGIAGAKMAVEDANLSLADEDRKKNRSIRRLWVRRCSFS